jgi:hypothetical protein
VGESRQPRRGVDEVLPLSVRERLREWKPSPTTRPSARNELGFEQLRQFFNRDVWLPEQRTWDTWLEAVQHRRNAIHAYRDREVGTHYEFLSAIVGFREFAKVLDAQVPLFTG